ncbi:MAG: alpha/beta hydrolase [Verrucomicrobiales bacterium]|nr:alpha/beta hydrolase [Verrucomicrobiales bacterium]
MTPKIDRREGKTIVVLIHGIRTHASWAEMVAAVVEPACGVKVIPLRYGYFDVFRFLCPFFTRSAPIQRIVRELRDIRADNPTTEISVIAHSFGTYALVKALAEREVRLHRVILCGCIVSEDFRRADYRAQLGPDDIVNDCGTHDIWPVLARSVTWGYGATGTFGLGTTGVRDRFNKFTHGDYFNREFVERYWVPFLRGGEILPTDWERERNSPPWWQSLLTWLPFKYVPLVLLILGGIFYWNWAEKRQRVELDSGPEINIGHYLGMPTLIAPLKVRNGTSREVRVESITTTLISPKGREVPMQMEGIVMLGQAMQRCHR